MGVEEILTAVIERIPHPEGDEEAPLQALIFDSVFNSFRGIIAYFKIVNGVIRKGDKVKFFNTGKEYDADEVGVLKMEMVARQELRTGDVGYIISGIKTSKEVKVGDTITHIARPCKEAIAGFEEVKPMVFAGVYPIEAEDFEDLRSSLEKLQLNDASLTFQPESSLALGFGFRCGFLGLLHMEIVQERLDREFDMNVITTVPNVSYNIYDKQGHMTEVHNPGSMPDPTLIDRIEALFPTAVDAEITIFQFILYGFSVYFHCVFQTFAVTIGIQVTGDYLTPNPSGNTDFQVELSGVILVDADGNVTVPRVFGGLLDRNGFATHFQVGSIGHEEVDVNVLILHSVDISRQGRDETADVGRAAGTTDVAVGLVASCKLCQNIFSAISVLLTYYDTIRLRTLHDTCFFCKYTDTGIDRCLCLHTGSYYRCLGGKKRHCLTLHVRSHQCSVCIIVLQERNQCCSNGEHHLWRYVHVIECSLIVLLRFFTVTTGYGITNKMSILIQFFVCLRYMVIIFLIRSHV